MWIQQTQYYWGLYYLSCVSWFMFVISSDFFFLMLNDFAAFQQIKKEKQHKILPNKGFCFWPLKLPLTSVIAPHSWVILLSGPTSLVSMCSGCKRSTEEKKTQNYTGTVRGLQYLIGELWSIDLHWCVALMMSDPALVQKKNQDLWSGDFSSSTLAKEPIVYHLIV